MPITSQTRGFQGRAIVNLTPLDGVGRKFRLGNTTAITENVETERTARQNFQTSGGGELDVSEAVTSVTAEMVVDDIKPETIAIGLRGEIAKKLSEAITGEKHNAWSRERISFKFIPDPDVVPTVSIDAAGTWAGTTVVAKGALITEGANVYLCVVPGTTGASEPVWPTNGTTVTDGTVTWRDIGAASLVKDTHYAITKHGVEFLAAADTLFIDDVPLPVVVGYTANPQYIIQALVNSGREFLIEIEGENAADNGAPNFVRYFRAKPSPTSGFGRVSTEFASLTHDVTLLEDSTRVGSGLSKYMELAMI